NLTLHDTQDVTWLTFSPDGTRLAYVSGGWQLGVWDLHELRAGLRGLGLEPDDLPERTVPLPPSGRALKVVRGPGVPPQGQWAKNGLALARWEAAKGTLPDAIDAASRALELIRQGDSPAERAAVRAERAEILNVRAQYHLLNHDLRAARDDWQQALS